MKKKKITHVICPYCCYKFRPDEADFRLNNCIAKDNKLYNYYAVILKLDTKEAEELSLQNMYVSVSDEGSILPQDDIDKYGFAQTLIYTDKDGVQHTADKRLCPFCHNELPIGYGLRETVLISILGDARAGKSIYLTMLINELENNTDFVSKLSFIGNKSAKANIYESYQKPLLKEGRLVDSTKRKKIPPFSYNYWYQYKDENGVQFENTIDLIFYDIAGEDLRDALDMRQNGFNIKDSSGLIFLLDPTNFKKLEEVFMLEDRRLVESVPLENSIKDIFSAMYNYFLGMDTEKSSIPLALAISKSDLFSYVDMGFFNSRPESRILNILDNEGHIGFFNIRNARALNTEVRELLEYLNEEPLVNYAMGCFKQIQCFAVSSLGKKPAIEKNDSGEEIGYVDGALEPFRVKEPFYWILLKNKLLLQYEETIMQEEPITIKINFFQKIIALFKSIFKIT